MPFQVALTSLSSVATIVNGGKIKRSIAHVRVPSLFDHYAPQLPHTILSDQVMRHKDVFTLGDRSFRWEYPETSKYAIVLKSPPRTPNKKNNALGWIDTQNYNFLADKLFLKDCNLGTILTLTSRQESKS